MSKIVYKQTDLSKVEHQAALVELLNLYAQDQMGGGNPLNEEVKQRLIPELQKRDDFVSFLAYSEDGQTRSQEKPVGLLNAFEGFSTFYFNTNIYHRKCHCILFLYTGISRS